MSNRRPNIKLVQVTAEHVLAGERKSCRNCPVALALEAMCNDRVRPRVGESEILIHLPGREMYCVTTPAHVTNFIKRFDDEKTVEPFEFTLDIPREFLA